MPSKEGRIALKGRANCPQRKGELSSKEGRIAIRPYTCVIRTLANIHINHVNTQKKRRHGHGMREFACVVGAKSASWRSGVCDAIRPCCNSSILQIYPILQNSSTLQNSPTFQIHPHFKFTHMEGRITIRPYTCVFWMLANIHVIKYKYTCKYLNTCKLMIERIYIPT